MLPPSWPPPTGTPVGSRGWYRASDDRWYRSDDPPAEGYVLGASGRWVHVDDPDAADSPDAWRWSRWGLGDVWWGVLVYLAGSLVLGLALVAIDALRGRDVTDTDLGPYAIAVLVIGNVLAFLGVPWLATRRKGLQSLRADFGLRFRPVDIGIGLGLGLAGIMAAGIVGSAIDAAFDVDETTTNVPVDTLDGVGQTIVFFVAVAVVTPVIEELFFRGLLYRSFLKRGASTAGAMVSTTIVFVLPHLSAAEDLASLVSLTASIAVLGMAFQLACRVTDGRLGAPILAHVAVNSAAVIALALR